MVLRNFAVIEGCDGSGTTTQLKLLGKKCAVQTELSRQENAETSGLFAAEPGQKYFYPLIFPTSEPTQDPVGILIKRILSGEYSVQKETLARLFAADRGEHLYAPGGIVERCSRGEVVVSDRYTPSSLVYQGLECGRELPEALNASFPHPELLIYLDVDPGTAIRRIGSRKEKREIYEKKDFQARVRKAYLELLPFYESKGVRVVSLDGTMPQEALAEEIWNSIKKMPIMEEQKY